MNEKKDFEIVWQKDVKEVNSKATLFIHKRSGAQILSMENEDENKVFGITFRTPPPNSTGVAHILEHSVLCGSRKYPLKEPFVELLKGSLQTFLNALTFPDKTSYPVASQNEEDFYNLIDVYLDAVFHPLLTKETFLQEGWHLEIEENGKEGRIVGVVYNEMKGAYSSPDSLLLESSQQSIFPDTPYGVDSGGNPEEIPHLTYEEFLSFHREYYHPSNSRIFFWGDDDPARRLEIVGQYLNGFSNKEVPSHIPLQRKFPSPRRVELPYPAEGNEAGKNLITVNWLLEETSLIYVNFALQILEYLLVNMESSTLKRALIESGLGEKITGVGVEEDLRQMYFSTGLKGVEDGNVEKVEALIFSTLERIYKEGFEKDLIEAAINSFEFDLRENNSGPIPRGLVSMFRCLTTWLYEEDPLLPLCFERPLSLIKANLARGERIFEELIAKYMLGNPHRSTVILRPRQGLHMEMEKKEKEMVKKLLKERPLEEIKKEIKGLKKYQAQEDSRETLARLPHLKIKDIPEEERPIPLETQTLDKGEILIHPLFTNNILYVDMAFDIKKVPQRHLPYVNLMGRLLVEMGTRSLDYSALDKKIQAHTGGIHHEFFISPRVDGEEFASYLLLRSKAMTTKIDKLFDILKELLLEVDLTNRERFKQILLQEKARLETSLIPLGHTVVATRLRAKLSPAYWMEEQLTGINYLLFLRYLSQEVDRDWDRILYRLERTREMLFNSAPVIFNLTGEKRDIEKGEKGCMSLIRALSPSKNPTNRPIYAIEQGNEAIYIPAQVNFVAKGMSLSPAGYNFKGSHLVVTRFLRNTWLWNKIRAEGGAYGAFASLNRFSKTFTLISYRDPSVAHTLQNFDGCYMFLKNLEINEEEIEKAVIGCIGEIDRYRLPDAKGLVSLTRYLIGDSPSLRQKMRYEILSTTPRDFHELGDYLEGLNQALVVVMGDEAKIKEAEEQGIRFSHKWRILE